MKTILFIWELGGGWGHIYRLAPLIRHLARQGHRVFFATRDLPASQSVFANDRVALLPTPRRNHVPAPVFPAPQTFTHILYNIGFNDPACLQAFTQSWRTIFELVKPDLTVFDHSPFALLAARGFTSRRVVIGSGFFIPPIHTPWPNFRIWKTADENAIQHSEQALLEAINRSLESFHLRSLNSLSEMYADADESFLTTYPELDHYPQRGSARYWGIEENSSGGKAPAWPSGIGKKIYAYLKPFPALPALLEYLNRLALPTIIVVDGIDPALQEQFSSPTLKFENERLDLEQVCQSCDVAITNATLNTSAVLLRHAKPLLLIPLMLEQGIISQRIQALNAGIQVLGDQPEMIKAGLSRLLSDSSFLRGAIGLASSLIRYENKRLREEMLSRIDALLADS